MPRKPLTTLLALWSQTAFSLEGPLDPAVVSGDAGDDGRACVSARHRDPRSAPNNDPIGPTISAALSMRYALLGGVIAQFPKTYEDFDVRLAHTASG
jgi:hypothetical protein